MSREIEMKQKVLEMLKNFLMEGEGGKFKPKAIEVEMVGKPEVEDEMSELEDVDQDEEMGEGEHDEMEEEEAKGNKPKMSLKDFLASRSE